LGADIDGAADLACFEKRNVVGSFVPAVFPVREKKSSAVERDGFELSLFYFGLVAEWRRHRKPPHLAESETGST
jgi:hypothetical protein